MDKVRLVLITDASFGNVREYKSPLGSVILLTDLSVKPNNLHYAGSGGKRVTLSVIVEEVYAL